MSTWIKREDVEWELDRIDKIDVGRETVVVWEDVLTAVAKTDDYYFDELEDDLK